MYHSVLAFQTDALVMAFYCKVSPECGIHIIDNSRSKEIGLSTTGEAEVAVDDLLDMFQRFQARQGIGSHVIQYLTEAVALLRHARQGAVAEILSRRLDHCTHEQHAVANGLQIALVLVERQQQLVTQERFK